MVFGSIAPQTPDSKLARKPKPSKIRSVPRADLKALYDHLKGNGFIDEAASLILANYLGVRPCEMRTITVINNQVHIIGGKKSAPLHRGADRTLIIENSKVLRLVRQAASWMSNCPRTNTAIRDRLRKECRALWPRRKHHPTLKSFRHQLGSNLKASGESAKALAYIMGHQSTDSVSREKTIGQIEFPAATRGHWFHEMKARREAKTRDM
ncbi:site-specific integrase [Pseudomonas helleri]|uniref:Tyrosine-type recombinase/integrase n=1 Tax=Pseudomonas helleri TaxID=1608996 RepID=A0A7X2C6D4_9PSED|nr:site-specific integrase [Pseudomonas helleri]MQT92197.1 hypothetical protein [Pseudomonas helleri]